MGVTGEGGEGKGERVRKGGGKERGLVVEQGEGGGGGGQEG
jgi:hypothetical protein